MAWRPSTRYALPMAAVLLFALVPISMAGHDPVFRETWTLQENDGDTWDRFGSSVVIDGPWMAVSAHGEPRGEEGTGAVYIYKHDIMEGWSFHQRLVPQDGDPLDRFGADLDLEADTLVVANPTDSLVNDRHSAVHIYLLDEDTWHPSATLTAGPYDVYTDFARSVALSGDLLAVGNPWAEHEIRHAGKVWIFERDGNDWEVMETVGAQPPQAFDDFGLEVALDGETLAVAAARDDGAATEGGAVHVLEFDGSSWEHVAKLHASDTEYATHLARHLDLDDDRLLASAPNQDTWGAVYTFERQQGTWQEVDKLVAPDPQWGAGFGSEMETDGDRLLVSAPSHDDALDNEGEAYLYVREGTGWGHVDTFQDPNPAERGGFGSGLDIETRNPTEALGPPGEEVLETIAIGTPSSGAGQDPRPGQVHVETGYQPARLLP